MADDGTTTLPLLIMTADDEAFVLADEYVTDGDDDAFIDVTLWMEFTTFDMLSVFETFPFGMLSLDSLGILSSDNVKESIFALPM